MTYSIRGPAELMQATFTTSVVAPAELCGCPVDCALSLENHTYLAIGPGGRGIVLKKLDSDCLWEGALHPNVKERLSRIRELAHPGIANLFGVGRDGDDAYLMWEYVPGVPFDEYATDPARTPRELAAIARELILTVDQLHLQGLVHGALLASNILVTPTGGIRLTHISPLLYTETAVDTDSVMALLDEILRQRRESQSALGRAVTQAREQKLNLHALGIKLAIASGASTKNADSPDTKKTITTRRRGLIEAILAAVIGLVTAYGIWHAINTGHLSHDSAPLPAIEAAH